MTNATYFALTENTADYYDDSKRTYTHEDIQVTMEGHCQDLLDKEADLAVAHAESVKLRENLADLRKLLANKKEARAPKVKAVPKYISGAGANAKAQRRLQGAGKLEPFREGGCRCRTWGNGLGSQCHAKAKEDGVCATHAKKLASNDGLWTCGFYDAPRPTKWGEECGDFCLPVPGDRKAGNTIPWKMDDETFATAFANMNELDAGGRVELDLEVVDGEVALADIPAHEEIVAPDLAVIDDDDADTLELTGSSDEEEASVDEDEEYCREFCRCGGRWTIDPANEVTLEDKRCYPCSGIEMPESEEEEEEEENEDDQFY